MRAAPLTKIVGLLATAAALHLTGLAAAPALAQAWADERSAGPVVIHANFALDRYDGLIKEIAALQHDLEAMLNVPAPREPIHIYLFSSRGAYTNYLRRYFPNVTPRRAMFIKGRGPGMVFAYVSDELVTDVRHEATHALLHASLPMVPLWLDEGLAEYFEVPREQRVGGNPHQAKTKWAARLGSAPSIERLEALQSLEEMNAGDYRHSWAVVHFMLHGSDAGKQELVAFLADIRGHQAPGKLSERLQQRIPNLNQALAAHLRKLGG